MASRRELDIVVIGASGYTGRLVAEYITQKLPTNTKWAIAGRSETKLKSLVESLKQLNSNRTPPTVITTGKLATPELLPLAKRTRVLLNAVGPYHLYSTPIVEACAKSGTHYIDASGETPWIKSIITQFESAAKSSGALLIPAVGLESTPSDLIAFKATQLIRKVWDCGVMDMVGSIHELKTSGASGGTMASGLNLFDAFSASELRQVMSDPYCLSPSHLRPYTKETIYPRNPEPNTYSRTAFQKWTGAWSYPRLGALTTSITARPNEAVVHRSAGLTPLFYGFNFSYEEYMAVSSPVVGMIIHFAIALLSLLLAFPPTRFIFKLLAPYKPGSGPKSEAGKSDVLELRGVAVAEQLAKVPRKALAVFRYEGGSMYDLTALLMVEAALVLLDPKQEGALKNRFSGGGFITPSCLGDDYCERIVDAGVRLDVKQIGDVGSK
ncbi:uncharacterized protein HMPREF1541_02321 [Cyphellophora europaea CBS 101466]|uniref:Saccharopine dehydrogenase NADP binding domain-containing protein n=1 Tax=Cyphellophora europaea (strain CBS 101466) TaxID=1220924 RepID=W2S539_CYPE1|nr:uncharacterized protein HMPREF1541_02321 [Cyphellophora europaea CBS 101466]ETN43163.1 hypothetical protein HMPREF1541_02321 [Cyphellophora europaea CBS 101466]